MPETHPNQLSRALRQLDLLEDYCDMFDRLVDMSDIGLFGDENAGPAAPGLPDAVLGASRAYLYPSATSVAYINETEFRWIRARSRAFLAVNPYAAGAVRNRVAYTVGSGHTYDVVPRTRRVGQDRVASEGPPSRSETESTGGPALASSLVPPYEAQIDTQRLADCRAVLAEFCRINRWPQRQKETVRRLDRDGERFLRFFPDVESGVLRVRFIEPLEIQNPPGAAAADGWFFGIRFARHSGGLDMETPLEYAVVDINPQGSVTELREIVPATDVQRLTANVDLSSPRGLPVFYALQGHLNDAVRTLKATGRIVEFRARIAMIRRHVNATRDMVQQATEFMRSEDRSAQSSAAHSGQSRGVRTARMYPYAAIIDTSDATDYQFPSEAAPVDKNVAAIQAELRAAAAALGMPEYMLSGDASNANYASTMVAEGPAVKTFEEMQAALVEADVEVLERALVVAAAAGRIAAATADDVLDLVSVQAEPPLIKSENRLQEVQADQLLLSSGVMSRATFAARHGLVYAEEKSRMEEEMTVAESLPAV
jgi:hypothetical protein